MIGRASLRGWRLVAAVAGGVGVALRLRQLLLGQSLWLDEALLARNIIERDVGGLLDPLSGQQGAPVGFLWTVKAIVETLGTDERLLRLPAFLAGAVLLPVVWLLARRLRDERVAAFAVAFTALAPGLVRYSAELKQYSSDALAATGIVLAGVAVDRERPLTYVRLALVGAVACWCSHPALLVCAAVGSVLFVRAGLARDRTALVRLALVGTTWLASVAVLYVANLRDLTGNEALTTYWAAGFPDSLRPDRLLDWLWTAGTELLDEMAGHPVPAIAVALLVVAVALDARRRPPLAAVLAVPAVAVVFAVADQYPLRGRLALYLVPLLAVVLATLAASRAATAGAVALVALLLGPAASAADQAVDPVRFPASREVIEHLAARHEDGDTIVLHAFAEAPFAVYGPQHDLDADGFTQWLPPDRCGPGTGVGELSGRVWFVFAYTHSTMPADEREILLTHLDAVAEREDVRRAHDALVARYDFDAPPTDPSGAGRRVTGRIGCLDLR